MMEGRAKTARNAFLIDGVKSDQMIQSNKSVFRKVNEPRSWDDRVSRMGQSVGHIDSLEEYSSWMQEAMPEELCMASYSLLTRNEMLATGSDGRITIRWKMWKRQNGNQALQTSAQLRRSVEEVFDVVD
jgi:hypothetical protein